MIDADPDPACHFDQNPDPDPVCHFDADPDTDPDPTFHFDAVTNPDLIPVSKEIFKTLKKCSKRLIFHKVHFGLSSAN